jgi:asparagine synthase (glutamine-hydrolysing)
MSDFLVISFPAANSDPTYYKEWEKRAQFALSCVGTRHSSRRRVPGSHLVFTTSTNESRQLETAGEFAILLPEKGYTLSEGQVFTARGVKEQLDLQGVSFLGRLAPPCGGCCLLEQTDQSEPTHLVIGFTDHCGLQHLFFHQGPEFAVLSNHLLWLACLIKAGIEVTSLGLLGLIGHSLEDRTPFVGIQKVNRGCLVRLQDGHCRVESYLAPDSRSDRAGLCKDLVAEGVELLRSGIGACLQAFPDCDLELSGGLDSRLILAGIPAEQRARMGALTLGEEGSRDRVIAGQIATRYQMKPKVVDLHHLAKLPTDQLLPLIRKASLKTFFLSNPFSRAVLEYVNDSIEQNPRFSGQNGEFARGFYYAGQTQSAEVTSGLVAALARWRIFTHQSFDLSFFSGEWGENIRDKCLTLLEQMLTEYALPWLESTDELYLVGRMQHWVGIEYSAASQDRIILAPFFNSHFLEWARSCPPAWKRGSSLAAELLEQLDPGLASFPLATGQNPSDLTDPGVVQRLQTTLELIKKIGKKGWQRLVQRGQPPVGAETLYQRTVRETSILEELGESLGRCDFLDQSKLARLTSGKMKTNWVSLGFLLNLSEIQACLESAEKAEPL